ncbi:magnesium transporter MRS2-3 isoform X2 [Magnolia sinica]|uniref:magnesium transporter MRS2-3 isoform X2 n=1 Tax=Magnolia sinica TaxID=86752 RepID=UPI002659E914|nr:magnesium transporter MRS2-3 isoform X2 [Magnolia sinica]
MPENSQSLSHLRLSVSYGMEGERAMRAKAPRPLSRPGVTPVEDEAMDPVRIGPGLTLRKKGFGVRQWLLLDVTGQTQVVEVGKHAIMRRTGLPARDLRILDPLLSYPSTVLGREKAIVINLEHIKAIITAQEVLLLNSKEPTVTPFVDELQRRLVRLHHATTKNQEGMISGGDADWANAYDSEEPRSSMVSPRRSDNLNYSGDFPRYQETDEKNKADGKPGFENGPRVLPFEFIALEACLEAACSCLDNEARTLEQEAHPALDKLTTKISTLNLERVRQIKSRLVAITGRVQKVRDELEHLLDDDDDMAEMYLTEKLLQQPLDGSSSLSSLNDRDGMDDGILRSDMDDDRIPAEISSEVNDVPNNYEGDLQNIDNQEHLLASSNMLSGDGRTHTSSTHSGSKQLDVEELEMLLEAYFVQIDGTLNKLSTITTCAKMTRVLYMLGLH